MEDDIVDAAKHAAEVCGDDEHRASLVTLTTQLSDLSPRDRGLTLTEYRVFEQPLKIPFLASFAMACNAQKPELVSMIVQAVSSSVQAHMRNGSWREVKLGLRMLSCLQALLEGDGVLTVLEDLFSTAVDLQTASSDDVRTFRPSLPFGSPLIMNSRASGLS